VISMVEQQKKAQRDITYNNCKWAKNACMEGVCWSITRTIETVTVLGSRVNGGGGGITMWSE